MKTIEECIASAIADAIREEIEAEVEIAQNKIAKAIRLRIGDISASVLSQYSMQRMGSDIVIRVHTNVPQSEANNGEEDDETNRRR